MKDSTYDGIFLVSGFDFKDNLEADSHECFFLFNKPVLIKSGVYFEETEAVFLSPSLGEWPLFLHEGDFQSGEWVVSNSLNLSGKASKGWASGSKRRTYRLIPGERVSISYNNGKWLKKHSKRSPSTLPEKGIVSMEDAISIVEESLSTSVRNIANTGKPVVLLLSAGVDSGILCSLLSDQGANFTALSIKTPWGDELEGATRTANLVGVPLEVLELTEDNIVNGVHDTVKWIQSDDPEIVTIQLLVSIAYRYASERSMDLVTGMGSDVLNSVLETGMESKGDNSLSSRVLNVSHSGLLQTGELTENKSKIHHPYWQASTIYSQLSIDSSLKSKDGIEKYYLRKLAERRIPKENAFGIKTAIHQGSNLSQGLSDIFYPENLSKKTKELFNSFIEI
jgi:asparagine synthetase B (glutamine-hydrolysing)